MSDRKRWVCIVEVAPLNGDRVTLRFPTGEMTAIPSAVSAIAFASPPPVIGLMWKEEAPDAR